MTGAGTTARSAYSAEAVDLGPPAGETAALQRGGRYDLLAGEAQLEAYVAGAVRRPGACALGGWMPAA